MKIEILGTGCPNCQKLAEAAEEAATSLGVNYSLDKVTEIDKIISFGVITTPALVLDGEIRVAGKVPSVKDLKSILRGK